MAAELDEELFKTTLMGGFDKDDVLAKFREAKEEAEQAQKKLEEQIREKDRMIDELRQSLKTKEAENEQLQKDIKEKYQSYIDNYDSIGKLVFDAKVHAGKMEAETQKKCDDLLRKTKEECTRMVQEARTREEEVVAVYEAKIEQQAVEAQRFMEQQMTNGRESYQIIRKEMDDMVKAMDELQKAFLESYKRVHTVKEAMGVSARKLDPFFRQLQAGAGKISEAKEGTSGKGQGAEQSGACGNQSEEENKRNQKTFQEAKKESREPEEGFLDEGMDFDEELENQIYSLLKDDEESEDGGQG